jgi:large subunit ribosomal protein L4
MDQLKVFDINGKEAEPLVLRSEVFKVAPKGEVVHSALVAHLANLRQGTACTKTRGEVRGGGKKPWKQKGTGRARAGSSRSPLWRGGGVIFGPKPRKYTNYLPKKVGKLAMRMVLSDKLAADKIKVLDEIKVSGKTKEMAGLFKGWGWSGKTLVLVNAGNAVAERAVRNIKGVVVKSGQSVNIFDLLNCEQLLAEKAALQRLEGRLL